VGGNGMVLGESSLERVAAEAATLAGPEQRFVGLAGAFVKPEPQLPGGRAGEWRGALLASLAAAAEVRAGVEVDVAAVEPGQLGGPQPGLDGHQQ
jgi:hypothetical protein